MPERAGAPSGAWPLKKAGGKYAAGIVFKLEKTGQQTVLYSFTGGTDGGQPQGGLPGTPRKPEFRNVRCRTDAAISSTRTLMSSTLSPIRRKTSRVCSTVETPSAV